MNAVRDADPLSAWLQHMRSGEWELAWRITDSQLPRRAREPCWHWPRHLQHLWTGQSLRGRRVLVHCYHGLGDTLQFIRYMPLLKRVAGEVTVWVQPALMPLLEGIDGVDRFVPLHDGAPDVDRDVDVEIMELAHVFRTTPETVPGGTAYLHVGPMRLGESGRPRVGLVWRAGDWAPERSIPLAQIERIADVAGISLHILQPFAAEAGWRGQFGIWHGEFDLPGYARVVRAMDLMITIDSMPAHMAGALGVPVWTLLGAPADWRWMDGRDDTPWYPRMRLFRQERSGDWAGVIDRVARELAHWADTRVSAGPGG